tara:strand:- start:27 stop:155 length:129 start_codon:yes stop_codon:yes gene_type:complete
MKAPSTKSQEKPLVMLYARLIANEELSKRDSMTVNASRAKAK